MLIKSFALPSGTQVDIPHKTGKGNRLTMLLGVNGTQKSTLLRGFLDTALEQISASTFSPLKGLSQVIYDRPPAGVIALSAIPNDRFPTKSRTSLRVRTRYEVEEYEYIGPRHNQNIISRNQSLGALVSAALTNRHRSPSITRFIGQMSDRTAIPAQFAVCLRPDMAMGKRGSVFEEFLNDEHPSHGKRMDLEFLRTQGLMDEFRGIFGPGNQKSLIVEIDLLTGRCSPEIPLIDIAIRHKLLQVRRSNARHERLINPEEYSAGQWGLFSSLVTLALSSRQTSGLHWD